ncbi:MAG: leucine-rich repeat domain-containing protein, partial [bacterium]
TLSYLNLYDNDITDVSPLSQLVSLVYLNLGKNQVIDIAQLIHLNNLTDLYLGENLISDVNVIGFLSHLKNLDLHGNAVHDLAWVVSNNGLGEGDRIWLENNNLDMWPMSDDVQNIRTLQDRGVSVTHDPVEHLFADEALDAAVREALGLQPGDIMLPSDLNGLTELDASNKGITNLTGMQFCGDLTTIYLQYNEIIDLTPLAGLTELRHLNLMDNEIVDITALSSLPNLESVYLSTNHIVDISPLAGLENLKNLALSSNEVTDLSALVTNLGLSAGDVVWVSDNNLDLTIGSPAVSQMWSLSNSGVNLHYNDIAFADPNLDAAMRAALGKQPDEAIVLQDLNDLMQRSNLGGQAANRGIQDLTGLEICGSLTSLDLRGNQISDVSLLVHLSDLTSLNLHQNFLADISPLMQLTDLRELILSSNRIVDLPPGLDLMKLACLDLHDNLIADLAPLNDYIGLGDGDTVNLQGNMLDLWEASIDVQNIRFLESRGVTVLHDPIARFFRDRILEEAVAETLTSVLGISILPGQITSAHLSNPLFTHLDASNRNIEYLDGIQYGEHVTVLDLYTNRISDISLLSDLIHLTEIDLNACEIEDISALAGLENLSSVILDNNMISNINPLTNLPHLSLLSLRNNNISDMARLTVASGLGDDDDNASNNDQVFLEGNPLDLTVGSDTVRYIFTLYKKNVLVSTDNMHFPSSQLEDALWSAMEEILRDAMGFVPARFADAYYLDKLSELELLTASNRFIDDITGLEYCTGLKHLWLQGNEITDLTPLEGLINLLGLHLDRNQITSLGPVINLINLKSLTLADNQIENVIPITGLTDLFELNLDNNHLTNIGPLLPNQGLDGEDLVSIRGNPLDLWAGSDTVSYIRHLEERGIEVRYDRIFFFFDQHLEAAIREYLAKEEDEEIAEWELQGISQLSAGNRGIADLRGIEFCTGLTSLALDYNEITGVEPLAELSGLTSLSMAHNQIEDLSPLSDLTNLSVLRLQSNQIEDIAALSGLLSLSTLRLSSNRIGDLAPLVRNSGLGPGDEIWVFRNNLDLSPDSDTWAHIEILKARGITVHHDPTLRILESIPHSGAGYGEDNTRVPNNTSFAVRIQAAAGVNLTNPQSVIFTIDDERYNDDNEAYSRNLGHDTVRVTRLTDDPDSEATDFWVVYHRSAEAEDEGVSPEYEFEANVKMTIETTDTEEVNMNWGGFGFVIETCEEHMNAEQNKPGSAPLDPLEADLEDDEHTYDNGVKITSGPLEGSKIVFNSNTDVVEPTFGPYEEIPPLAVNDMEGVGVPLNLQPPTVFSTPVKVVIPFPGVADVSALSLYLFNGLEWVPAYDSQGIQPGGEGWIVPESRQDDAEAEPPTISLKLYHFTGLQAAQAVAAPENDGGGGSCFIDFVFSYVIH